MVNLLPVVKTVAMQSDSFSGLQTAFSFVKREKEIIISSNLVATHLAIEVDPVSLYGVVLGRYGHPDNRQGVLFGGGLKGDHRTSTTGGLHALHHLRTGTGIIVHWILIQVLLRYT